MKKLSLMMVITALCVSGFSLKSSAPEEQTMGHSAKVEASAPQ